MGKPRFKRGKQDTSRLRKIWQTLEKGHAKMTYTDLYSSGVIAQEDYLKLIKEIEEDEAIDAEEEEK